MKERLSYPNGLRFPHDHEFPADVDIASVKQEYAAAEIVPGYRSRKTLEEISFRFFAECNVPPEKLWAVFTDLVALLPESDCRALIGMSEDLVSESDLGPRAEFLEQFAKYAHELTHDTWLQFGILHETETLMEVLVPQTKYIQFWGEDEAPFVAVMERHRLPQNADLAFYDEFPTVAMPLGKPYLGHAEVYEKMTDTF